MCSALTLSRMIKWFWLMLLFLPSGSAYHVPSAVSWPRSLQSSHFLLSSQQKNYRLRPHPILRNTADSIYYEESSETDDWRRFKSLTAQTLRISLPALIGMLVDPLLSCMDTAYVGRLGSLPLAALGSCTSIFHLAFNAFRATTSATTSLVSQCLSDNNSTMIIESNDSARLVTQTSLQLGVFLGILVAGLLFTFGTRALASMGVDRSSPLFPYACQYLFCRCGAAPVVLFLQVCEGSFRGHGDTRIPLLASLTAAMINLVLDPLLMFSCKLGVRGAALATAMAQVGAAAVYWFKLKGRRMLPQPPLADTSTQEKTVKVVDAPTPTRKGIIREILGANAALFLKQGSLLLAWAYATARATRLGPTHVAAHQVSLSIWLVFALIMDSTSVAAQVLVSRARVATNELRRRRVRQLLQFFAVTAAVQGLISMLVVDGIDFIIPVFTSDPVIRKQLHSLIPCLAAQQLLVSATLVTESCAVGLGEFSVLGAGTALATIASVWQLSLQQSIQGIWNVGIVTLLGGRFLTALVATARGYYRLKQPSPSSQEA